MTAPTSKTNPAKSTVPAQGGKPNSPAPAQGGKPVPAQGGKPESAASVANRTAPVATPPKSDKPKPPALDFSKLSVVDAPAPVRKSSRKRADNPLVPVLKASWDNRTGDKGAGKSATVPTDQATELTNLIRYAANQLSEDTGEKIGSAIVAKDNGDGTTTVTFAAKRRRNRKTKDADQAATAPVAPTSENTPTK